jgi:hypothetical protein
MPTEERCKMLARECLRLAQLCTNPSDKDLLMEMAEAWRARAEETARQKP